MRCDRLPLLLIAAVLLQTSCTDAKLEPIPAPQPQRDDRVSLEGRICMREPENLVFPLRVLFIVDSSSSMEVNDPPDPIDGQTGRERAVRETWEPLLSEEARGIRFGVIRFSSQAQSRTASDENGDNLPDTYYSADPVLLDVATAALGVTDRTTNYVNALGEAYYEMRTELLAADLESLPLSKYVVIFLSDGEPDTDDSDERENSRENIVEGVKALRDLAETFRVGEFSFHTAFLSSGREAFDQSSRDLLEAMAEAGGGNFRSFPSGEELNFLFVDLAVLKRAFTLRSFGAFNTSMVLDSEQLQRMTERPFAPNTFVDVDGDGIPGCGEPLVDTDGDGLSDFVELESARSNPFLRDSDDDGLSDALEWRLAAEGLRADTWDDSACFVASPCTDADANGQCDCLVDVDQNGVCDCAEQADETCPYGGDLDCVDADADGMCDCPDADQDGFCDYADQDGDGLHDCEEILVGTARNGVDSDADGIPDPIEFRFRTNPAEIDDDTDRDTDSTLNAIEIISGTNPLCEDTDMRWQMAYRYRIEQEPLDDARACYSWEVGNVTVVPTLRNPGEQYPGNGWNRIIVWAGEVAFDDPRAFASFRLACAMAAYDANGDYKNPPSGRIQFTPEDFIEVSDFDPDQHCKWP